MFLFSLYSHCWWKSLDVDLCHVEHPWAPIVISHTHVLLKHSFVPLIWDPCIHREQVCPQYLSNGWLLGLYPFIVAPLSLALHSGAPCDTCCPVQVNGRRWMHLRVRAPQLRFLLLLFPSFFLFGQRKQKWGFPLFPSLSPSFLCPRYCCESPLRS